MSLVCGNELENNNINKKSKTRDDLNDESDDDDEENDCFCDRWGYAQPTNQPTKQQEQLNKKGD